MKSILMLQLPVTDIIIDKQNLTTISTKVGTYIKWSYSVTGILPVDEANSICEGDVNNILS